MSGKRYRFVNEDRLFFHAGYRNRLAAAQEETRKIVKPAKSYPHHKHVVVFLVPEGVRS